MWGTHHRWVAGWGSARQGVQGMHCCGLVVSKLLHKEAVERQIQSGAALLRPDCTELVVFGSKASTCGHNDTGK